MQQYSFTSIIFIHRFFALSGFFIGNIFPEHFLNFRTFPGLEKLIYFPGFQDMWEAYRETNLINISVSRIHTHNLLNAIKLFLEKITQGHYNWLNQTWNQFHWVNSNSTSNLSISIQFQIYQSVGTQNTYLE